MISVVVPIYNVNKFLNKCISSIANQSYKEIEIILIDDGSTDSSSTICDEWKLRDSRIIVIHQKNQGLSGARNRGIEIAKGEFITFIDSDDFVLCDFLSYLHSLIRKYDADISVCQPLKVDEQDNIIKNISQERNYVIEGNENCMEQFFSSTYIDTTAWCKLYKTSLFKKYNISYPLGKYHEDVFTTYKLISKSNIIAVGCKALYCYRQRLGSIVNSDFSVKHFDGILGKIERYEFIKNNYPKLNRKAASGIITSTNQCALRLAKSQTINKEYTEYIQKIYRSYGLYYLTSTTPYLSKIFVLGAIVNVTFLIKLCKIVLNLRVR